MMAAVTAVYGGYDHVPPVPEGFDKYVLVSDVPVEAPGWEVTVLPRPGTHPCLAAKLPKFRPDWFVDADSHVWMDANARPRPAFAAMCRDQLLADDLILWAHPEDRDCLFQEVEYCADWAKYRREPLRMQAAHYRQAGMPEHFGLWATGCIATNRTPTVGAFGMAMLGEMERGSFQDQVAFPFLAWLGDLKFGVFDAEQKGGLVSWVNHLT